MTKITAKQFRGMKPPKRAKYHNTTVVHDGIKFDSIKEKNRYILLKSAQDKGQISGLDLQARFELLPAYKEDGKCIEKPVFYVADFIYFDHMGELIVEDVKSTITKKLPAYILKKKMLLHFYKLKINQV